MRVIRVLLMGVVALGLSACASKFRSHDGPEVTQVLIFKGQRMLHLMHHDEVLFSAEIELGFAPMGHKRIFGDGRTPEGAYVIDRRNPDSRYHLSIGISYPDARDRSVAGELGMSPGGDIFIHGTPRRYRGRDDWTAGCIAVGNREMERIYAMVPNGTPITIYP